MNCLNSLFVQSLVSTLACDVIASRFCKTKYTRASIEFRGVHKKKETASLYHSQFVFLLESF